MTNNNPLLTITTDNNFLSTLKPHPMTPAKVLKPVTPVKALKPVTPVKAPKPTSDVIQLCPFDKIAALFGFEVLYLFPPLTESSNSEPEQDDVSYNLKRLKCTFLEVLSDHYTYLLGGKLYIDSEKDLFTIQPRANNEDDASPALIIIDSQVAKMDISEALKTTPFALIPPRAPTDLIAVKCTLLHDGALAIGVNMNHGVMDGEACFTLMKTWGNYYRGEKNEELVINHDRTLLFSKGTGVQLEHAEYKIVSRPLQETPVEMPTFPKSGQQTFHLSPEDLRQLKAFVAQPTDTFSTLDVVTALMATLITQARGHNQDVNVTTAINMRNRTTPPLPPNFTANAVMGALSAHSAMNFTSFNALTSATLQGMAQRIRAAVRKIDGAYIADTLELLDAAPPGSVQLATNAFFGPDVFFSSWVGLGAYDVDFGAHPLYAAPPTLPLHDGFVFILEGMAQSTGIDLLVFLEAKALERLRDLWAEYIPACWRAEN